tara:strand:- start:5874 stop:6110 length:237 start_codon:yes stop_codon:yes gene_type:complete
MASKFWVLSNEDSKASFFRANHAKTNNGKWAKNQLGWSWKSGVEIKTAPITKVLNPAVADTTPPVTEQRQIFKKILKD